MAQSHRWLVLLVILSVSSTIADTAASPDHVCHVDVLPLAGEIVTRVNCTNRNLLDVPDTLPITTAILLLDHNFITDLGTALGKYRQLQVLNVAYNKLQKLSADNFKNLSLLTELHLNSNGISLHHIDEHVFVDIPKLKLLNVACDRHVGFKRFMKILADAPFVLDTLIIDGISLQNQAIVITADLFNVTSLLKLRYLSVRQDNIVDFDLRSLTALTSVEHLNVGYNTPIGIMPQDKSWRSYWLGFVRNCRIVTIDFTDLFNNEYRPMFCRRFNTDISSYFHKPIYTVSDIEVQTAYVNEMHEGVNSSSKPADFLLRTLPPSLRFVYASGIALYITERIFDSYSLGNNNIQYINCSGSSFSGFNGPLYGLEKLEVLDFSNCGISHLPDRMFSYLPKLRVLLFTGNNIPNINTVMKNLNALEILDISHNNIARVEEDMFEGLFYLQVLDISGNFLNNIKPRLSDLTSLSHMDMSFNNIRLFSSDFMSELNALSNETAYNVSLRGNPFVCTCHSIPFVKWMQKQIKQSSEQLMSIDDGDYIHCLYQNNTDRLLQNVSISKLERDCKENLKFVDNLLKTVFAPVSTIVIIAALVALLCYRLRWQIWWEWYVVFKKRDCINENYEHDIFIACEDSIRTGEFVTKIQKDTAIHIESSKVLNINEPELDQIGNMIETSQRILFFIDNEFIDNIRQWELLIPEAVKSRPLARIALVLDIGVMEKNLCSEFRLLWILVKSNQCLGYYNEDTNGVIWNRIMQFVGTDTARPASHHDAEIEAENQLIPLVPQDAIEN